MAINYVKVGKEIKRIRREKGWTQAYLAELVDLSNQYISAIETAHKTASLQVIFDIAEVLDVSLDVLFGTGKPNIQIHLSSADLMLQDCTEKEEQILLDLLDAAKRILRENRHPN